MFIFHPQEINNSRQREFDLIKAVTILLMIWTHVFEKLSTYFVPSLSFSNAYYRGSIFGAATFMFCMGIGMVYTRSKTPRDYFLRGIRLSFIAILLNFFRFILAWLLSGDYMTTHPESAAYLVLCIQVDILNFAGLAFLLMALLRKLGLKYWHILLVSVALSLSTYFLEGFGSQNFFINQFMGFFWGNNSDSYFPLCNWFIFVAAGCVFGKMYLHLEDKNKFHLICFPIGLVVTLAYLYLSTKVQQNVFLQFKDEIYLAHRRFPDAALTILSNCWLVSLYYFICKILPTKIMPVLVHPAKYINQYYCISWFIIQCARYRWFINNPLTNDAGVFILWSIVFSLTVITVLVYNNWLKQKSDVFFGKHHTFWVVFVLVVTLIAVIYGYYVCDGHYPTFINRYSLE